MEHPGSESYYVLGQAAREHDQRPPLPLDPPALAERHRPDRQQHQCRAGQRRRTRRLLIR